MTTEQLILRNLINDESYSRRVLPYIKAEYFTNPVEKIVFDETKSFILKYGNLPTKEALVIQMDNRDNISDKMFTECKDYLSELSGSSEREDETWLIETTEKFCQDKAVYNAIMDSIQILDGKTSNDKGAIPGILSEALSVSFDQYIGHDFFENADERYDFYHRQEERIPFDLEYMNLITKNGLPKKTLNIVLAGTGVGKSLAMCHFAANNLMDGRNVLYITLEMAEERIAERIDANLLSIPLDELSNLPKPLYEKKIEKAKAKTNGKLIVKEYPTASAHVGHFRHLLHELKLKKGFVPDVIYIDYLNICASSRVKGGANVNSYTLIKAIAEELRGLAVECNVPLISATQTTRGGYNSSDVELTDTSESFGLPATADFMVALIATEELKELDQIMVKQLKNRYNDPNVNRRFVVGVDRSRMKLYDTEQSSQEDIIDDDKPLFDRSSMGSRMKEEDQMQWATKKFGRKNFSGINMR